MSSKKSNKVGKREISIAKRNVRLEGLLWNVPRNIHYVECELKESVNCIRGSAEMCLNPKKCNRKNACNEELKEYF